jgi:hypothetical protein
VQPPLQPHRVFAEDQRVYVEAERDGGVAEFVDPIHGIQPPGQPDLDHALPEGTDGGNHVHVAGTNVGLACVHRPQAVAELL